MAHWKVAYDYALATSIKLILLGKSLKSRCIEKASVFQADINIALIKYIKNSEMKFH